MPRLPQPREGERLRTNKRPTQFSLWPTKRNRAHARVQTTLFALEPWGIIENAIIRDCMEGRQPEAKACLKQARDFYSVGTEKGLMAARPLALYYCYMNLLKVLCLTRGNQQSFNNAQHGITEIESSTFSDIKLKAFPSPSRNGKLQNFSELLEVVAGSGVGEPTDYPMSHILPQILPGHRIWSLAENKIERFIAIEDIQFWWSQASKEVWLRIYVFNDDLSRWRVSHNRFLNQSCLSPDFREVDASGGEIVWTEKSKGLARDHSERRLMCFEQVDTEKYHGNHPADTLHSLVSLVKSRLWCTVSTVPPYRRYYVYLSPDEEAQSRLPQLLSVYALTYHLGSITRYRPHDYDAYSVGKYGPRLQDFVTGQPAQFLYLIASEIAAQEIAQPSII